MPVRMVDLPSSERPRERLARLGVGVLSDQELLALVIRSGGRGTSALEAGTELLGTWGSLDQLALAGIDELCAGAHLGKAKAAGLVAAFELGRRAAFRPPPVRIHGPQDLALIVQPLLAGRVQEEVILVVTNAANRVLRLLPMTRGGTERCLLVVRDILSAVLRCGGSGFAIAHNHPSGEAIPSPEDVAVTDQLRDAAKTVGLRFLDHIVLAAGGWQCVEASS